MTDFNDSTHHHSTNPGWAPGGATPIGRELDPAPTPKPTHPKGAQAGFMLVLAVWFVPLAVFFLVIAPLATDMPFRATLVLGLGAAGVAGAAIYRMLRLSQIIRRSR